ncbi:MAG: RidA family protein, partial [Candidatus Tectomicrobia bacterium]|nr:RidA family protein [Candidatus Tectomicrobia bacterium]
GDPWKSMGLIAGVIANRGKLLFMAGQVANDVHGNTIGMNDIVAHTRQIYENMKAILEESGGSFRDLVKQTTFYVIPPADRTEAERAALASLRREYYSDHQVASTGITIKGLARPEYQLEIEAIACIGE